MNRSIAFTLIELLVVVAIIAILLAILTPALEKAVYQAELAVCAANHKLIVTGATTYAMDFKRSYPYRSACHDAGAAYSPYFLKDNEVPGTGSGPAPPPYQVVHSANDDRPELAGYMTLNAFVDPLGPGKIDLSMGAVDPESWLFAPYALFLGWRYDNFGGIVRLGDRLRFQGKSFTTLVVDREATNSDGFVSSAHPDMAGRLGPVVQQNAGATEGVWQSTQASWLAGTALVGPNARGTLDRNAGRADGSVQRYSDLGPPPQATPNNLGDYPMHPLPVGDSSAEGDIALNALWVPPN